MIVVDASAALEVLLRGAYAAAVEERLLSLGQPLHAPHLLDIEAAQTIRRYVAGGQIESERGRTALVNLADFPMTRCPHAPFLPRIWELRHNLTAYDAAYVALAEALDAPLLTRDKRIAAASGHVAEVVLVS